MTLASTIEVNTGLVSSTGIVIAVLPGSDPSVPVELWRAPDSAGAPDTANAVMVLAEVIKPGGTNYVDLLPTDGVIWWYRSRTNGNAYGPSPYTDWVNLGTADRLMGEAVVALGASDAAKNSAAWAQQNARMGPQVQNILPNSGWEDGLAFWFQGSGAMTAVNTPAEANGGNWYLKLTSTTGVEAWVAAGDDVGKSRYFEVNTGDLIQFGGWVYRVSGTANVTIRLEITDKDKANPVYSSTPTQNTAAWVFVQGQYIVPAGMKFVRFYVDIDPTGVATVARFDDAYLRIGIGAISDVPSPNTRYQIRFATGVADPDLTDGMQSYIDFPATTNFMRVGQVPFSIASSTNATPIVVTTSASHGYSTGDRVTNRGHLTNTAANGTWTITVIDNTSFSLNGSVGNGVGGATGHSVKLSLIIAPDGALTVFATVVASILNAASAVISGLLSALGGLLVRNSLQHSTAGTYGDTTVKRVLLENDSVKLMGDVGGVTNNEAVRIGDYTVSGPPTARSTTSLNDPASGSRGWTDPDASPPSVTYIFTGSGTWTVPQDWNNSNNLVTAIGAGGNGGASVANTNAGGGGGGGEHRTVSPSTLVAGGTVTVTAGSGTDAQFGAFVTAKKGANASGATAGAGGTGGSGGTGRNGAAGGNGSGGTNNRGGGGGGGAGGDTGAGTVGDPGFSTQGGNGGDGGTTAGGTHGVGATTLGNPGGNGGSGQGGGGAGGGYGTGNGGAGGAYGGGAGGGGSTSGGTGSPGSGGVAVVIITYTPATDNGMNSISRTTNGSSSVSAANALWQKLGDATEGANIPSYDGNYAVQFKLVADASTFGTSAGTVVATVTAEYTTVAGFASGWTALGGSWSVTAGGSGSAFANLVTQVFNPTFVIAGSPAHVAFRFTTQVTINSGPGTVGMAVLKCFVATYKTDNYAATWQTAGSAVNRRGTKSFATVDGGGVSQPHASWAAVTAVGTNMAEGELQFVGSTVHGPTYQDDEATRYIERLLGVQTNKTTTSASEAKLTSPGIALQIGRINVTNRILRIRAGGTIGANTGTVNLQVKATDATAGTNIATISLASNDKWLIDVELVVQTAGASGTVRLSGWTVHGTTIALLTGTITVDTTAIEYINITGLTAGAVTLTLDEINVRHMVG